MVKEIGHVSFKVKDMKAAQDFYVKGMGFHKCFEIRRRPDGEVPTADEVVQDSGSYDRDKVWIVYIQAAERQFIELFTLDEGDGETRGEENCVGYLHLALIVEDIHAFREEIVSRGVEIDIEPKMGMDGTWQMWVHDPDGNKIECMQYTDKSAQLRYSI